MSIQFPVNKEIDQAQEKILQAESAQEIKNLLNQGEPLPGQQIPNYYQEGLTMLVTEHIMKQFSPEDIDRIEKQPESDKRYDEILKLASNMDNDFTKRIMIEAASKHNPLHNKPEKNVGISVSNSVLDSIKYSHKFPNTLEKIFDDVLPKIQQDRIIGRQLETAKKAGYVQGVCECVAAIGDDHDLGKKLLTEMNVNRDMAKKFASPETFKVLEQGIFVQKKEQTLEQTQTYTR